MRPPSNSAPVEEGWRPLYNGLNFRGWRAGRGREGWSTNDWRIACKEGARPLVSSSVYHDFELIVDVGPGTQSSPSAGPHIILGAANARRPWGSPPDPRSGLATASSSFVGRFNLERSGLRRPRAPRSPAPARGRSDSTAEERRSNSGISTCAPGSRVSPPADAACRLR